jgi:glycosyltransferase involved in cell wall biosynthesis
VPSFAETFSLTILEALAMGKPVVASDVGGTSEMIVDGVNGFLVPPRDSDGLAQSLKRLIEDRALLSELGERARDSVVRDFSLTAMVKNTESVFQELLREKKRVGSPAS